MHRTRSGTLPWILGACRLARAFMAATFALEIAGCAIVPSHVLQTNAGQAALERGDHDQAAVDLRMALLARPGYESADTAELKREAEEELAGKVRSWLGDYFATF